jgi:hypothetical protein
MALTAARGCADGALAHPMDASSAPHADAVNLASSDTI